MATSSGALVIDVNLKDTFASLTGGNLQAFAFPQIATLENIYTNGAGAGQISKIYGAQFRQVSPGINLSLDLTTVRCTDYTIGFSYVRVLFIWVQPTSGNAVAFGNDGITSNLWTGALVGSDTYYTVPINGVYIDQFPLDATGYAVDSTHKILRFVPAGTLATWNVVVLGS